MKTLFHSNIKSLYQVLGMSIQIHPLSENAPEENVLDQRVEGGMLQKEEHGKYLDTHGHQTSTATKIELVHPHIKFQNIHKDAVDNGKS